MERKIFKGLLFEGLCRENFETAVAVQRQIFPREDGKQNFLDSLKNGPARGYGVWLIKLKDECIGVIGLYHYPDYPEDAWGGWGGITEQNRGKGYGTAMMDFIENEAKERGFKNFRFFTDDVDNKNILNISKKRGVMVELYSNPDDYYAAAVGNIVIVSKSLSAEPVQPWGNKYLGLKELGKKQNAFKQEDAAR
ncbi:MAG: GNAT family N-acetyltransferase [Elusimicrobia bacterium]|nr:GNAT family N-acetyltransferase [Elusimicrobiota bacterium]